MRVSVTDKTLGEPSGVVVVLVRYVSFSFLLGTVFKLNVGFVSIGFSLIVLDGLSGL
jgi:hypothetical protein